MRRRVVNLMALAALGTIGSPLAAKEKSAAEAEGCCAASLPIWAVRRRPGTRCP